MYHNVSQNSSTWSPIKRASFLFFPVWFLQCTHFIQRWIQIRLINNKEQILWKYLTECLKTLFYGPGFNPKKPKYRLGDPSDLPKPTHNIYDPQIPRVWWIIYVFLNRYIRQKSPGPENKTRRFVIDWSIPKASLRGRQLANDSWWLRRI